MFVKNSKIAGLLAALALTVTGQAWAVGTASTTPVDNTVTVDYEVSSVGQAQLSDTVQFLVDNKVDLTVAQVSNDTVIPNQTNQVVSFTVTNTGNTEQGYLLAVENDAGSDFAMNNVRIYIEDGTTAGFQSGEDTLYVGGTNAGDLDPNSVTPGDDTMTVYIVADVPPNGGGTSPSDTDVAAYNLLATTTVAGSTTVQADNATDAWAAGTVQVVYAEGTAGSHSGDADNDGQDSAQATYTVASAALTVTKSQAVISDGFSPAGFEKAIPGAVVRYTITLDNSTGSAAASALDVIDDIQQDEVTYNADSVVVNGEAIDDGDTGTGTGLNATVTITDEDTDTEDDRVRVSGFIVPAGASWDITFDVTID